MTIASNEQQRRRSRSRPTGAPRRGPAGAAPRPPWWFALPAMLLFAFVVLVPSARGVYYAFTDWDGLDPDFAFIGLDNFADMLATPTRCRRSGTRC